MAQAQIIGRVTSLTGAAFARDNAGNTRRLKTGDVIREGETVSATDGSEAMLKLADGRDLLVRPGLPVRLDSEVAAMIKPDATDSALSVSKKGFQKIAKALSSGGSLDTLLDEDAPAAGGVAGTGNEGHTFIELLRIAESVAGANGYQFDATGNRSGNLAGSGAPILTSTFALTIDAPDNTRDTTPTISGRTELVPGSVITLTITDSAGLVQTVSTTVKGDGTFSIDVPQPLTDGNYTVTAIGRDQAGNTGTGSDDGSVDATMSAAPKVEITTDSNNDGFINHEELNGGDVAIKVSFDKDKVSVGDKVEITSGGVTHEVTITVTDKANGYVTTTYPAQADGTTVVATAYITDLAGNKSNTGEDRSKLDLSALNNLRVQILTDSNDDEVINKAELNGGTTVMTRVTLPADAVAGDLLLVTSNTGESVSVTLTQSQINAGKVDVTLDAPPNGTHLVVKAQVSDPAGNTSDIDSPTAKDEATIMTDGPEAPLIRIDTDSDANGYISRTEQGALLTDAVTITLPKNAKVNDTLTINDGTTTQKHILTDADIATGTYSTTVAKPAEGTILHVSATVTDHQSGNVSDPGTAQAILDTTDFKDLAVSITTDVNNDGFINKSELTNKHIDVRVTLPAGAAVGDTLTVTGYGNTDQTFVLTAQQLADGHIDVRFNPTANNTDFVTTVSIRDNAGNSAGTDPAHPISDAALLQLDNPGKPIVTITPDINNDGYINKDELNGNTTIAVSITLTPTAEAGDSLLVSINGATQTRYVLTQTDINRNSVNIPGILNPGEGKTLTVTAQVMDKAGNIGEIGEDHATIDTTKPVIQPIDPESVSISEKGLSGSNTDSTKANGTLSLTDNSTNLHLSLAKPSENFTSGGKLIVWTLENEGHLLIGHIGTETGIEAIRVTIDDQGTFSTKLSRPFDHSTPGESPKTLNIDVEAKDEAGNVGHATLPINIRDDVPTASPTHHSDNGIYFTLSGENTPASHNVAPDVHAFSNSLLGLVGIDALNLIDLSGDHYQASDANNNITKLVIESGALLSINLGGDEVLTWSQELASALGLKVVLINDSGLLGLGSHFTLTITSLDPAHPVIDNLSIKELLSTLRTGDALLNLNILEGATITATDAYGASDTADIGTLLDLSLLNGAEPENVTTGTSSDDSISGDDKSNILLGNQGKDILTGMGGNDVLHGGSGNDRLDGGTGNDLLIGGAGNDALHGGDGNDVYSWNLNDRGTAGNPAIDTIDDFGNGRDILRITGLLTGNGVDSSLPHKLQDYVHIEKTATGDALIHISSTGGFAAGYDANKEDQRIILTGYGSHLSGNSDSDLRSMLDNHQLIIGTDTPSTNPGGGDQAQGSLGSFGADGGHVEKVTVNGHTYSYADADGTTHVLTIRTSAGETITINMDDGTYHYTATTPLTKGHYTALDYTLIDNDGDRASSTLRFMGTADPVNVAPDTNIATSNNLLGIIGLATLDLIDISTQQAFTAFDANENLSKVEIKYTSFLTLGTDRLAASQALAHELGLVISVVDTYSFLGAESVLTITSATPGGTISNLAVNELLGTVYIDQSSLIDLTVGNSYSITATDSQGLSHTSNDFTLLDLNLLNNPASHTGIQEGSTGNDTLTGTAGSDRLYGYSGDDILVAGDDNDLIRAGAGNDQLSGGNGTDILIGSAGNDILVGDAGSDIFRWEFADQGNVQNPAVDIIADFETRAGGDLLDLRDLLQDEFHMGNDVGNLGNYLHFTTSGDNTIIDIKPTGSGGNVTQEIVLYGVDLSHSGALGSDAQIIQNLLQNGKLLTD